MGDKTKRVKLVFHQKVNNEIVVDGMEANEWDDFLIVYIKSGTHGWSDTNTDIIQHSLKEYADRTGKEVILVPEDLDIQFYGVEVDPSYEETE